MARKRRKLPNGTGSIERVKLTPQGKTRVNQHRARLPKSKGRKDIGFYKTYNDAMEALINYQEPTPLKSYTIDIRRLTHIKSSLRRQKEDMKHLLKDLKKSIV